MQERKYFMLISIVSDKNNLLNNESTDWTIGRFKQIYWGSFLSDDILKKIEEINKSANEIGYKILNTRKVYSGKIQ